MECVSGATKIGYKNEPIRTKLFTKIIGVCRGDNGLLFQLVQFEHIGNEVGRPPCALSHVHIHLSLAPGRAHGVRLLLAHYQHRITYLAGLDADNGAVRFLQGLSPAGNVTADHSRSFTSPDGQAFLLSILSRDKASVKPAPPDERTQTSADGTAITTTVQAPSPSHFQQVSGTVRLEKGQYLELRSLNLGHVSIVIQEADKT